MESMHVHVRVNSKEYCPSLFPFLLTHGFGNWMTAMQKRTGGGAITMASQRYGEGDGGEHLRAFASPVDDAQRTAV